MIRNLTCLFLQVRFFLRKLQKTIITVRKFFRKSPFKFLNKKMIYAIIYFVIMRESAIVN